jgi:hypothetical protein
MKGTRCPVVGVGKAIDVNFSDVSRFDSLDFCRPEPAVEFLPSRAGHLFANDFGLAQCLWIGLQFRRHFHRSLFVHPARTSAASPELPCRLARAARSERKRHGTSTVAWRKLRKTAPQVRLVPLALSNTSKVRQGSGAPCPFGSLQVNSSFLSSLMNSGDEFVMAG